MLALALLMLHFCLFAGRFGALEDWTMIPGNAVRWISVISIEGVF
jgi:hypothetical protein